ncbi:MAG: ADP-ribosylglycohydrolase family protein [Clostridia bacterium]|nr:ADP-ribosylglycohydrolase family protein [Clostridia bacterium]
MMNYNDYLDKVKGCFLGKTVLGTLGAPYEGVKMPMDLKFDPAMIDTMLPNDDLDLQVLWLEVVEKKGLDFTSYDLLKAFCENCDYSPGEYAVMRKNFEKGIYPPYSGWFCNDFYVRGMGCPIRSEIWAALSPGNPLQAMDLAEKDGVIDHCEESVVAEQFLAAMESLAYGWPEGESIDSLIMMAADLIEDSEVRRLAYFVHEACAATKNVKEVLALILDGYGHPDCTNMLQNLGIILASLMLGEGDVIKTGMTALNCGFDTDCTCATVGAILGILKGADKLKELYGWDGVRYVLGVRANRRSDLVSDLAEDVAGLCLSLSRTDRSNVSFEKAPPVGLRFFEEEKPLSVRVEYLDDDTPYPTEYSLSANPSVGRTGTREVRLCFKNNTDSDVNVVYTFKLPPNLKLEDAGSGPAFKSLSLKAGEEADETVSFSVADPEDVVFEKNIIGVIIKGDADDCFEFGLSGNKIYRLTGPIWATEPPTNEEILSGVKSYWDVMPPAATEAEAIDNVRRFHLNFAADAATDHFDLDELFGEPERRLPDRDVCLGHGGRGLIARPYLIKTVEVTEDSFCLSQFSDLEGPCVFYMSQKLYAPEDMTVFAQVGYSSPFKFYVNGELIGERHDTPTWDAENAHFADIKLKKGENRVVLRLARYNSDAKYSLVFSKGLTCSEHYCCFGTKAF